MAAGVGRAWLGIAKAQVAHVGVGAGLALRTIAVKVVVARGACLTRFTGFARRAWLLLTLWLARRLCLGALTAAAVATVAVAAPSVATRTTITLRLARCALFATLGAG